jgi:hypothetical protein
MPLSEDDIREILRLIDESDVEELRVETEAFSLHVIRSEESHAPTADVAAAQTAAEPEATGDLVTVSLRCSGPLRAEAGHPVRGRGDASSRTRSSA